MRDEGLESRTLRRSRQSNMWKTFTLRVALPTRCQRRCCIDEHQPGVASIWTRSPSVHNESCMKDGRDESQHPIQMQGRARRCECVKDEATTTSKRAVAPAAPTARQSWTANGEASRMPDRAPLCAMPPPDLTAWRMNPHLSVMHGMAFARRLTRVSSMALRPKTRALSASMWA
eukprot:GHVU01113672.1.p2 GENE.GHVU01113672.1~~GHVU01113672.1.p2  ORF type:complete len:174 (-),score=4.29 GHVU01113672.1:157-678(-)